MTATFFRRGEGRSRNARIAESENRMPLSRAKKAVAESCGCSQTVAAAALELLHDGEWHHVGKYAAEVAYYDTEDSRIDGVVASIVAAGGAKKFAAKLAARRERSTAWAAWQRRFGPGGWAYNVNRIARLVAGRAQQRQLAVEVLGRSIKGPHRINDWSNLWPLADDRRDKAKVAAARAAGWSEDRIVLAMLDSGERDLDRVRACLRDA